MGRSASPPQQKHASSTCTELNILAGRALAAANAETALASLVAAAHGVVLEIGPGIGGQLPRYDKAKIERIYGVEPNALLHHELRAAVKSPGLEDRYQIVGCGVEDFEQLASVGVGAASIDTVLSVQVLCSVADPEAVVASVYALLKLGGEFIVYEYMKRDDWVASIIQGTSF